MPKVIRFAGLLIVAGMAGGPAAADEKKPNTLTPKEIAEGWVLLHDGETLFGWTTQGDVFLNADGHLVVGSKGGGAATTASFGEGELRLTYARAGQGLITVSWPGGATTLGADVPGKTQEATVHVKPNKPGPIGLHSQNAAANFSRVAFRPAGLTPLFNGKDLTGWKAFDGDPKRNKSKFEVTPAGELRVTNGPGDLQTEKQFADFVLQLECKTNGKNLNSGVFFRCVPDQYQNGYEAQIHNGFKDNDRTKPVDFGTGAIYRRVPARKVVANDNEWFTMTVVADGPHVATWVNGYQTVDWTDDRPADDNPRKGSKTAAGHISIQGHDPTTDLLFRNIRIAELPAR